MKRLLLISYSYPPMQSAGAYRTASFTKHLPRFGYQVSVLTVEINQFTWNGALDNSIPISDNVVRTKGIHIGEVLKSQSRSRLRGYGQTRAKFQAKSFLNLKNTFVFFYDNILTFPDSTWFWYLLSREKAYNFVKQFKPDILLSSALPISSHFLARSIQKRFNIPWVADYRDLWSQGHVSNRKPAFKSIENSIEQRLLRKANALTTVSAPLSEKLRQQFKKPVHVITNGFDPDDLENIAVSLPQGWKSVKINAVYTGMIYPHGQNPGPLFEAILLLTKDSRIKKGDFLLRLFGPNVGFVKTLFSSKLLDDFVSVGSNLVRKQALNYQKNADLLVIFDWSDPKEKGIYTTKFFEYIGAGKPILSIGPKGSVIDRTLKSTGLGVSENDPYQLSEIIYFFLKEGKLPISKFNIKAYENISKVEFTREYQVGKLADVLNQVLQKKTNQ